MNATQIACEILNANLSTSDINVIGDALRTAHRMSAQRAAASFAVGERVSFRDPLSGCILNVGVVKKVNPKNIKVQVGNVTWNVTATLLSHYED